MQTHGYICPHFKFSMTIRFEANPGQNDIKYFFNEIAGFSFSKY
jgi:hypothetical protein